MFDRACKPLDELVFCFLPLASNFLDFITILELPFSFLGLGHQLGLELSADFEACRLLCLHLLVFLTRFVRRLSPDLGLLLSNFELSFLLNFCFPVVVVFEKFHFFQMLDE